MLLSKREFARALKDAREGDSLAALKLYEHYTYGLNQPEMAVHWEKIARAGGRITSFGDLSQTEKDAIVDWASSRQ